MGMPLPNGVPLKEVSDYLKTYVLPAEPKSQLFFCHPYDCSMMVSACIRRQEMLVETGNRRIRRGMGYVSTTAIKTKFEKCISCSQGKFHQVTLGIDIRQIPVATPIPDDLQSDLDIPE